MKTKSRPKKRAPRNAAKPPKGRLTAKLVRIGNSRGIRLPKAVIEQAGLKEAVEISVRGNQVILRPANADSDDPRAGWEEQIKKALAEHGDDVDEEWLNAPLNTEFDEKEWTW